MSLQGHLDFGSVCDSVLSTLQTKYPLDFWTISRINGNDFIVLKYTKESPRLQPCITYNLHDTIFSRMPKTPGVKIVPDIHDFPEYCEAPMAINLNIQGGMSVPIYLGDTLFGSLCGMQSRPLNDDLLTIGPEIETLVAKLSDALASDFAQLEAIRAAEQRAARTHLDPITQLLDWHGWDALLDAENMRCRTYGNKGFLISIDMADLKGINQRAGREAGDAVLSTSAKIIQSLLRPQDIVARVGSDQFGILCIEHPEYDATGFADLVYTTLQQAKIDCYVGHATSLPHKGLRDAWEVSEHMMYKTKKLSKLRN